MAEFNTLADVFSAKSENLKRDITRQLSRQIAIVLQQNYRELGFVPRLNNPDEVFNYVDITEIQDDSILITLKFSVNRKSKHDKFGMATTNQAKYLVKLGYKRRENGQWVPKSASWILTNMRYGQAYIIIKAMEQKQGVIQKRQSIKIDRRKLLNDFLYNQIPSIEGFIQNEITQLA